MGRLATKAPSLQGPYRIQEGCKTREKNQKNRKSVRKWQGRQGRSLAGEVGNWGGGCFVLGSVGVGGVGKKCWNWWAWLPLQLDQWACHRFLSRTILSYGGTIFTPKKVQVNAKGSTDWHTKHTSQNSTTEFKKDERPGKKNKKTKKVLERGGEGMGEVWGWVKSFTWYPCGTCESFSELLLGVWMAVGFEELI